MIAAPHILRVNVIGTVKRFPLASACSILFMFLACWMTHARPEAQDALRAVAYLYILGFGCFWFIALQLFSENHPQAPGYYRGCGILLFLCVGVYLYLDLNLASFTRDLLYLGAVLSMFMAPYLGYRSVTEENTRCFWIFSYRLVSRIVFTLLAAIVLYCGLAALVASVQYLFGLRLFESGTIYFYLWIIVASGFSPLFAMAGIPQSFRETEETYPRFLRILTCNLAIPLWLAYAAVVYTYIAKILFTMHLPEGGVAILISVFSLKGILLYLAAYPLYKQKQGIAYWFCRYNSKLLVIPLILLALAIGERIHVHGVTEDRYAILLSLVWIIFFIVERLRNEIEAPRRIIMGAIILLFLASFGPWGIDSVSTESQINILQRVLEKNAMFAQGKLIAPAQSVSFADRAEISSIVDYLVKTHKTGRLIPWFAGKYQNDFADGGIDAGSFRHGKWPAQIIVEDMGLKYTWQWETARGEPLNNFNYNARDSGEVIAISGYDYMVKINNYTETCSLTGHVISLDPGNNEPAYRFSANFKPVDNSFTLTHNATGQKLSFDVGTLFKKSEWPLRKQIPLIMESENTEIKARMIVTNAYGNFEGEKPIISNLTVILLIKWKIYK